MSEDIIASALAATRDRIARHEQRRTELESAIATARQEEKLLQGLLDLRRGDVAEVITINTNEEGVPGPSGVASGSRHKAVAVVVEELAAAGRPLHISELMRLLGQRQVPIPGAGTQANLITHLRRDARLVRPSRGMYALAASGLENMPAGLRRRRGKRLRVKATGRTEKK
jgi:hypothetical protein